MRKKEKWTNKENDKHEDAHSLLHNTTIVKNLGAVLLEKSLTKILLEKKKN